MKTMHWVAVAAALLLTGCERTKVPLPQNISQQSDAGTQNFVLGPVVHHPDGFRIAIIDSKDSVSAGHLYTVIGRLEDPAHAMTYSIMDSVLRAQFSPDGKWLTVVTTTSGQSPQYSLWLVSSDGKQKDHISVPQAPLTGEWVPNIDVYVFGVGRELLAIEPGDETPHRFGDMTGTHTQVRDVHFSPNGRYAALLLYATPTRATPNSPPDDFDIVELRDLVSGQITDLFQSNTSEGIRLGPWAADSQSFFYWLDPLHSASLIADGTTLSQMDLQGHTHTITTTLTETGLLYPNLIMKTVLPYGEGNAVLQTGTGREVFKDKWIGFYQNGHITEIPKVQNQVGLSPTVTTDGSLIAFAAGPSLSSQWGSDQRFHDWKNSFVLDVYNTNTKKLDTIQAAGTGVQTPIFTSDSKHVIFVKEDGLWLIPVDGHSVPAEVAKFPDGTLRILDVES
ncbi:hypothetical protein [Alicyclobacillus macrosporangiidus]|uniref:hypothetical protein n=1 Tax=Alicyclobacillus macrosporangiidus TaxID=392015 RepID=UPI000497A8EA|nr:hypothetical protein [Alicyclobacillus macrosporangiidus]